jgi:hypothetical protein
MHYESYVSLSAHADALITLNRATIRAGRIRQFVRIHSPTVRLLSPFHTGSVK